ncbi:N-methylhydantoinase B [Bradyrhizobium macuxiense]|uniref:N-methylhydantoinase B n=1 Tax=Bradyrhizobium macuxiense TaxID=1755647 RepID=A0A560KS16_9BRAD|nr:hydantoinase B/oxoprolinase family protein [Bradyrhizobium macuxiense]TWB86061.1 N-methylhydantoinase B [Bradyrhizobium macuxiense]
MRSVIESQILWNRLIAVCEEQAQVMIHAAFSPPVRESGDVSAGLFDLEGRMLTQAVTGTPGHVNSMAAAVVHFFDEFPVAAMKPGDAYVTNDPWLASGHLNDVTIVTPAFHRGKIVGLFAATVHLVDLGGRGMGPDGRDIFEEGVAIPHMHLTRAGALNRDLVRLLCANSREPLQTEGDLLAILAAGEEGARRLSEMLEEFNLPDVAEIGAYILETSRSATEAAIRRLPEGVYYNKITIDGYEKPVDIAVAMTLRDGQIALDFAGTSPCSAFGINVPLIYTGAYAFYGIKCVIAPEVPCNHGALSRFSVTAPMGTIVNPQRPAPVSARHIIGHCLPDAVMGCLEQALPGQTLAESGMMWNPYLRGTTGFKREPRTWEFFSLIAGGMGARSSKDGLDATAFPAALKGIPVEAIENTAPMVFWRKELRTDSGGAGKFRGGSGQIVEIGALHRTHLSLKAMFDRIHNPARGRDGGQPGAVGRVRLASGAVLAGKGQQDVPVSDRLVIELPGGGGYGDPAERELDAIAYDVRRGLVSQEAAERDYRHFRKAAGAANG